MLVLDNNNDAIIIESIHAPMPSDHIWVLDLEARDFMPTPLVILEETVCPTLELLIMGYRFCLPCLWNILVVDEDTQTLDVVEVRNLPAREFRAFVYGALRTTTDCPVIQVIDYFPNRRNVGPMVNRHQMLCHPISPTSWVNVSPTDTYNKYLKNLVVGDLI